MLMMSGSTNSFSWSSRSKIPIASDPSGGKKGEGGYSELVKDHRRSERRAAADQWWR